MRLLISLISFLLTLAGCDQHGDSSTTTTTVDGVEVLNSIIEAPAEGVATLECVKSASGQCYYTVFTSNCAASLARTGTTTSSCATTLVGKFAVAAGGSKELIGLPAGFRHCVSQDSQPLAPYCNK